MKSTEFCYWLQGLFEINPPTNGLTKEQVSIIQKHLSMVFYHEIDKMYPENEQKALNDMHNTPGNILPTYPEKKVVPGYPEKLQNNLMRC